jgi:hypothetical protein
MTEPVHDAVLHRLVYVERAMHQWQVVGSLAMALLVLIVLLGAVGRTEPEAPEEIRAQAFVLVDREGRPRIDRRVARNDSTHLALLDREGLPRMSFTILSQGGADIVIRDQLGLPRASRYRVSREVFVRGMRHRVLKPTCCWDQIHAVRVHLQATDEALVEAQVGVDVKTLGTTVV